MGGTDDTIALLRNNERPAGRLKDITPVESVPTSPLMQNMFKWINALTTPSIIVYTGDPGLDAQTLVSQLNNYTSSQFASSFSYSYLGEKSCPPLCSSFAQVYGVAQFYNESVDNYQVISNWVTTNLIPNSTLPSGNVQRQAASNLYGRILTILAGGDNPGWVSEKYHRQYADGSRNWIFDAQLVWTYTKVVDKPWFFVDVFGVTYPIENPA